MSVETVTISPPVLTRNPIDYIFNTYTKNGTYPQGTVEGEQQLKKDGLTIKGWLLKDFTLKEHCIELLEVLVSERKKKVHLRVFCSMSKEIELLDFHKMAILFAHLRELVVNGGLASFLKKYQIKISICFLSDCEQGVLEVSPFGRKVDIYRVKQQGGQYRFERTLYGRFSNNLIPYKHEFANAILNNQRPKVSIALHRNSDKYNELLKEVTFLANKLKSGVRKYPLEFEEGYSLPTIKFLAKQRLKEQKQAQNEEEKAYEALLFKKRLINRLAPQYKVRLPINLKQYTRKRVLATYKRNRYAISKLREIEKRGQKKAGLYLLFYNKKLVYIGVSEKNVFQRIRTHFADLEKEFTHFKVYFGKTYILNEYELIADLNPRLNKRLR